MRKDDARKLTHNQLTELRRRGVGAVLDGEPPSKVARILGVNESTLFGWLARYRQGGWDALDARKRGGRPPKLTAKMLKWIYDTVTMKDPLQMKFPFALWTSRMVATIVMRKFKITLSKASVCRLLNQLGLTVQKPLWRAFQQDPQLVEQWLKKEYPRIRRLAKKLKAKIFFGDEAGIRSDFHSGTTWAVRGKTPVIRTTGARFGMNLISAVSAKGQMRFMVAEGRVTGAVFIEFLKRLIHNAATPIFLIVDGHPTHRSVAVAKFVDSTKGKLQMFFLPPYSPELNPDEYVWNDLKNNGVGRIPASGPDQLKANVVSHMRRLQKKTVLVRSFFQAPETIYASA